MLAQRFISVAIALFFGSSSAHAQIEWVVAKHDYQGLPLFLRYPVGLNYDEMAPQYPLRVVVTLKFAKVLGNGLPDAQYNRSLEEFDEFLQGRLSQKAGAQCVLVETFNGKRMFYAYAARESVATELREEISKRYAELEVTVAVESDPKWSLIRNYSAEYFPSRKHGKN